MHFALKPFFSNIHLPGQAGKYLCWCLDFKKCLYFFLEWLAYEFEMLQDITYFIIDREGPEFALLGPLYHFLIGVVWDLGS